MMEDAPIVTQTPTLSKKELKRQRKREFYQEQKKQRKLAKTGKVNNDNQSENDNESEDQQHEAKEIELNLGDNNQVVRSEKKQAKINKYIDGCRENFHIIIDCDWEKEHTDSTLTSLTQQIMFCYGISRRSSKPVFIHISNLKERTRANLHAIKFENWTGVTYSEEDYINDERYCPSNAQETEDNNSNKKELVYLTADAEETITELDPNCAYILGGIVDRNRLKGVTYEKAKRQKIRTAKLPIRENIRMTSSQVLTINHVFEIIMRYNVCQDWKKALEETLPKRKDVKGKSNNCEDTSGSNNCDESVEE